MLKENSEYQDEALMFRELTTIEMKQKEEADRLRQQEMDEALRQRHKVYEL